MAIKFKNIILIFFILISGLSFSQTINYSKIVSKITSNHPNLDISNKILIVSVWNSTDASSRDMNKEFFRTYKTYQHAKLSGGLKGVIFISISSDAEELNFKIAAQKDISDYPLVFCDYLSFQEPGMLYDLNISANTKNLIFNSSGELIFSNLETNSIFITFNKLTTR